MPASAFADTNVILYAIAGKDPRSTIAERIVSTGPAISVQVLNEFVNVTRRRLRWDRPRIEEALTVIEQLCGPPIPITHQTHRSAVDIARRYDFSMYDALILAAALEAECTVLYSEDMQSGQKVHSLTVRNPFTAG